MQRRRVSDWLTKIAVTLLVLAGGCRGEREQVPEPIDTDYLASTPVRQGVTCHVAFARYNSLEQAVIEEAWSAAEAVDPEIDKNWRANGLRISSASGEKADEVRKALATAGTLKATDRQVALPSTTSFDVLAGRRLRTGGIVYENGATKAYKDVVNLQMALRVTVLVGRAETRLVLEPFFSEGEAEEASGTMLSALRAQFRADEGRIILIGPVEKPDETRLGSLFVEEGYGGGEVRLVIVEPILDR